MTRPTDRERLLAAFRQLAAHGIAARPAHAADPEQGHAELRVDLAERHPYGVGSYVFWTAPDDARFDASGRLTADLPLHCSGAEVAVALEAACRAAGLDPRRRAAPVRLTVAAPPRNALPQPPTPSPWRWLGPARVATAA